METIGIILSVLVAFCAYTLYEYYVKNSMHEHVKWCVGQSSSELFDRILFGSVQTKGNSISDMGTAEYMVQRDEQERMMSTFILEAYQEGLKEKYFSERLKSDFKIARMSKNEYFMVTLCSYLSNHECDLTMNGQEKYILIERKNYGMWGTQLYDATYELTDFAIVYTRLYYTTLTFCNNCKSIETFDAEHRLKCLKERIDTRRIQISVM